MKKRKSLLNKSIATFFSSLLFLFFSLLFTPLSYSGVASEINSLLSSEGKILFGEEPNSILVIDYPENLRRIEEYLKMVDTPPKQVLIEARVVEVKLQKENALGINWQAFAKKNGFELGQFKIASSTSGPLEQQIPYKSTNYPPGSTSAEDPFTITIFDDNINIVLKALASSFDTNILSAPRVTTVNNRPAEIKIIEKLPWAEPEVDMNEFGIAVSWNINFEEVGISLKVTPTITDDGKISMEIHPEVSEKVDDYQLTVVQGSTEIPYTVPVIDTRTADTKVVIGNGQTLIIGGLIKEKTTSGVSKVPFLGDIPGLGWFFKSKKDTKDKTELLIFVSPTIITPQVVARMGKKENLGIGRWYMEERRKEEKILENKEGEEEKLLSRVNSLEKKLKEIIKKRKILENKIF
ncbi:MAG TPA: type II secretion system protein GspD [Candidatus Omnitrophica bacterium]|nr:type II secretion system protein GspD [Candidatus Omnitrophota bacterium]